MVGTSKRNAVEPSKLRSGVASGFALYLAILLATCGRCLAGCCLAEQLSFVNQAALENSSCFYSVPEATMAGQLWPCTPARGCCAVSDLLAAEPRGGLQVLTFGLCFSFTARHQSTAPKHRHSKKKKVLAWTGPFESASRKYLTHHAAPSEVPNGHSPVQSNSEHERPRSAKQTSTPLLLYFTVPSHSLLCNIFLQRPPFPRKTQEIKKVARNRLKRGRKLSLFSLLRLPFFTLFLAPPGYLHSRDINFSLIPSSRSPSDPADPTATTAKSGSITLSNQERNTFRTHSHI